MLATNNVNINNLKFYNVTNVTTAINLQPITSVSYDTIECVPKYKFTPNKKLT